MGCIRSLFPKPNCYWIFKFLHCRSRGRRWGCRYLQVAWDEWAGLGGGGHGGWQGGEICLPCSNPHSERCPGRPAQEKEARTAQGIQPRRWWHGRKQRVIKKTREVDHAWLKVSTWNLWNVDWRNYFTSVYQINVWILLFFAIFVPLATSNKPLYAQPSNYDSWW